MSQSRARTIDSLSKKASSFFFKEYIVIGSERVSSLISWALIMFTLGITFTAALIASRSGTLEQSRASDNTFVSTHGQAIFEEDAEIRASEEIILHHNSKLLTPFGKMIGETAAYIDHDALSPQLSDKSPFEGYIVELPGAPAIERMFELKGVQEEGIEEKQAWGASEKETLKQFSQRLTQEQNATLSSIKALAPSATIKKRFKYLLNGFSLSIDSQEEAERLKEKGYKVWKNIIVTAQLDKSVPLIGANKVWTQKDKFGKGIDGNGISIAILDTGVDYRHPDLGGCLGPQCKVAGGYDVIENDPDPMDLHGHGTHVAAIAAGNGTLKGVAPGALIYAYRVLDAQGNGTLDDVIVGLERALDPNDDGDFSDASDIANMSLGTPEESPPLEEAVKRLIRSGMVVVVAAGNSGPGYTTTLIPGVVKSAITVGASNDKDKIASFSSRGPVMRGRSADIKPDVVAPGVGICAAKASRITFSAIDCVDGKHISLSGTSMATPHVAGVAALLKQKYPTWGPYAIKSAIRGSAVDIRGEIVVQGFGRVNVLAASLMKKPPLAILNGVPLTTGPGQQISIKGTADAPQLKEYRISIGENLNPTSYKLLHRATTKRVNNLLYTLNSQNFSDGYYVIKLEVETKEGAVAQDRILIRINTLEARFGDSLGYLQGKEVVKGKILLPGAKRFRLDYSKDLTTWTSICPAQAIPSVAQSFINLCTIDVSTFTNGIYYFRLAAFDTQWKFDKPVKTAVRKNFLDRWPIEVRGIQAEQHLLTNIDKDLSKEMIYPHGTNCLVSGICLSYALEIIQANGARKLIEDLSNGDKVAPADIFTYYDKEHKKDLMVIKSFTPGPNFRKSYNVIDEGGKVIRSFSPSLPSGFHFTDDMGIFDINGDGQPEFFLHASQSRSLGNERRLYGFDIEGKELKGFPIIMEPIQGYTKEMEAEGLGGLALLHDIAFMQSKEEYRIGVFRALTNRSDDNQPGALFGFFFEIYSSEGVFIKRVKLFDDQSNQVLLNLAKDASIGDLDGDGSDEIAITYTVIRPDIFYQNPNDGRAYRTYVKIFDAQGKNIGQAIPPIQGYYNPRTIIANLGYGTRSNVILALSETYATRTLGNRILAFDVFGLVDGREIILWDRSLGEGMIASKLVAGDIDNNGNQEIVFSYFDESSYRSGLFVLNRDGTNNRILPIPNLEGVQVFSDFAPTLSDMDNDGNLDVVVHGHHLSLIDSLDIGEEPNYSIRFFVIKLGRPYGTLEWPMVGHDTQRSNRFQRTSSN